jgi:hypothetical protein
VLIIFDALLLFAGRSIGERAKCVKVKLPELDTPPRFAYPPPSKKRTLLSTMIMGNFLSEI